MFIKRLQVQWLFRIGRLARSLQVVLRSTRSQVRVPRPKPTLFIGTSLVSLATLILIPTSIIHHPSSITPAIETTYSEWTDTEETFKCCFDRRKCKHFLRARNGHLSCQDRPCFFNKLCPHKSQGGLHPRPNGGPSTNHRPRRASSYRDYAYPSEIKLYREPGNKHFTL